MISNPSFNTASRNVNNANDDDDEEKYQSPVYRRSMTKNEAVMHTRVDMTGNLEYSPRRKSSKLKVDHAPSLLGVEQISSTGPASVEARLAKLIAEQPDNERALELKHKLQVRKANNAAKQRHLHSLTTTAQSRTTKSAESLGSMSRLDIQALYGDTSPPAAAAGTNPNRKRPETTRCRDVVTTSSAPTSTRKITMKNCTISKSSSFEWNNETKKSKGDNYDHETNETIKDQDPSSDRTNRSLLGLIQSIEDEYVSSKVNEEKIPTKGNDNITTPQKVKRKKSKKTTKMTDSGHNNSVASFESCLSSSSLDGSMEAAKIAPSRKPYRKKKSQTSQAALGLNDSGTSFESNLSSSLGSMEKVMTAVAMISSPTKQPRRKRSKRTAGTKRKSSKVSTGEMERKPLDDPRENKTVRGDIECGKIEEPSTQSKPQPASHAAMEMARVASHDKTRDNKGMDLLQPRRSRHRILVLLAGIVMAAGAVMLILWILDVTGVFQWLPTDGGNNNDNEARPPSTSPAHMISSTTDGVGDQGENNVFSNNNN